MSSSRGFTLIETIMAMSVLLIGVLAGFAALSQSIRISPFSRQQMVAASLAQDALEAARSVRDDRILRIADTVMQGGPVDRNWSQDLPHCGVMGSFSSVVLLASKADLSSGWVTNNCAPGVDAEKIYVEPVSGFRANLCMAGGGCGAAGWEDTGYRRIMEIEKYVCGDPTCTVKNRDDACTDTCAEVRLQVKVYWGTDAVPATCPSERCIIMEDRLADWVDYLTSFF